MTGSVGFEPTRLISIPVLNTLGEYGCSTAATKGERKQPKKRKQSQKLKNTAVAADET